MANPKKLTNEDYCGAAKALGCEVAALMAVAEVESAGGGYDDQGRIKVRFEGHKFRTYTFGKYDKSHPHLSYVYKVSRFKKHGYEAFNEAFALDPVAALKASSFGKFQPLAANYREAGFTDVRDFVDFLRDSEVNQLIVFCLMVKFRHLVDELQRKDWAGFAENYNGAAYRDNDYDGKMRRADERYEKLHIKCGDVPALSLDINIKRTAGELSQKADIPAVMSDGNTAGVIDGGGESDGAASTPQVAENINNISTGDKTIPDNFTPENKTATAPAAEGSTKTAGTITILGVAVPLTVSGVLAAIKSAFDQGFIDGAQVFSVMLKVLTENIHFVFYLIGLIIILLIVKKLTRQITLWIEMYIKGRADMHNVEVVPGQTNKG